MSSALLQSTEVLPPVPVDPNCGFDFVLDSDYFTAPTQAKETKSVATELPDGRYWLAKFLTFTVIYGAVYATAGAYRLLKQLIETLAREFNLYTSVELLGVWEKSVSLPDTRLGTTSQTLCERRRQIQQRLKKYPIVTIEEMQTNIDNTFPDYGIWISSGESGESFRYSFRYFFGPQGGTRARFVLYINIPWIAIDPLDLENSPLTWENLKSWFRDFVPGYVELIPIYHPENSYCIITSPQDEQTIYVESDGAGGYKDITVYWKEIDKDGTVVNNIDTENVDPDTTDITREFIDSDSNLISITNDVEVMVLL